MGLRTLSPGGHEYLTRSVACGDADRLLDPGEQLSDYFLSRGYPAGTWYGTGADTLGLSGDVTAAQMTALYGEGRHPNADAIEADLIAAGATQTEALQATKLGRRFPQYQGADEVRSAVLAAYRQYNRDHDQPANAPIPVEIRTRLRHGAQVAQYREHHAGVAPASEHELHTWLARQARGTKTAVSGYELVFAPDKTVSVAWALAAPAERDLISGLVHQAARDTVSYVEQHIAFTRHGSTGEAQVDVEGITAALFTHWDSRAGDPHLHIHALVSNKVQRSTDGAWVSLDGRTMHAAAVTASEYFDSRLRDLFRDHGAAWTRRTVQPGDPSREVWQLAGVPETLVSGFSQRHIQFETARAHRVVAFRREHGREPTPRESHAIDRAAQYDHRPAKGPPETLEEHRARWRTTAHTMIHPGLVDVLGQRVFSHGPTPPDEVDLHALAHTVRNVVAERHAHFTWWNLAAEAHRQTAHLTIPPDKRQHLVDDVVDAVLVDPQALAITGHSVVEEPATLRRRDGESVFVERHSTRYTTTATLSAEADLVAWARLTGGHRLRTDTLDTAMSGTVLNVGQRRMVTGFARSGHRLQLALAPAGTGKTTAMRVLATAWRRTGHRVYAFGPSARAAHELGTAIGATPHTLDQLTTALHHGTAEEAFPITAGDLVIVDEAAMAGTHTLHTVIRYVLERGGDVRLIGDTAQLTAVAAGGAVGLLAREVGALQLHEVVRFRGDHRAAQAAASIQLRDGNPEGIEFYLDAGWVASGSVETMRAAAHAAWRADLDAGRQSLLIVPTVEDTTALNREARALRLARGDLQPGREVGLHDGTRAGVGDWVVTRHNDRLLGVFRGADFVKNGDTWTITTVHRSGAISVRHREHQGTITLPAAYVAAYVELAYAATVHRVQGMTSTGTAHLLAPPTMTREQLYPGLTRAMLTNMVYVITHQHLEAHQQPPVPRTAREVLAAIVQRSGAEVSATETLRDAQAEAWSLATLVPRYTYAATYRDTDRYRTQLTHHAPTTLHRTSTPALIQTLRTAHHRGWDTHHLLGQVLRRGPLEGADDPAAVLQHRIATHLLHRTPPPLTAHPTPANVARWQGLVHAIAPHLTVTEPQWDRVWRRAAGALSVGIDPDTALTEVAHQLAERPRPALWAGHQWAEHLLTTDLAARWDHGEGHHRPLPWMARPDLTDTARYPGHTHYLHHTTTAIHTRLTQLHAEIVQHPPGWATQLGPRPAEATAGQWDSLITLTAAYRETFRIDTTDPALPLGEEPENPGVRADAWHELTNRWRDVVAPASPSTGAVSGEAAADRLGASDLDAEDEVFGEFEPVEDRYATESLDVLVRRYDRLARDGDADRYLDLLARYAPDTINAPSEHRLLAALADAQDHGWQADRLLNRITSSTGLGWADDPAAVLAKRVRDYTPAHPAPARTGTPTEPDQARWHALVTAHLPDTDPADRSWDILWRHTAAAHATGHDTDDALTHTLDTLTTAGETTPSARQVAGALVAHLAERDDGLHPALPWQAVPDLTETTDATGLRSNLDALNGEISARFGALRDRTTRHPPTWARSVGPRPDDPIAAEVWERTLGLIAAYRETYTITTTDPSSPLGTQPPGTDARAQVWQRISTEWRHLMTTAHPEDAQSDAMLTHESRLDHLDAQFHAGVDAHTDALNDETDEQRLERAEDDEDRLDESPPHSGLGY